jgi:small subunit ribosomal protein S20
LANTKSAKKAIRQSEKRQRRNRPVRTALKTFVRGAERQIATGSTEAETQTTVVMALSRLDRAAVKGIIHKNQAARRKSRLMKKLNAATTAAS